MPVVRVSEEGAGAFAVAAGDVSPSRPGLSPFQFPSNQLNHLLVDTPEKSQRYGAFGTFGATLVINNPDAFVTC